MPDTDDYFCICTNSRLWVLGNHGDFEAAEDTARSLGVEPVWMFGREAAIALCDNLNQALPKHSAAYSVTFS